MEANTRTHIHTHTHTHTHSTPATPSLLTLLPQTGKHATPHSPRIPTEKRKKKEKEETEKTEIEFEFQKAPRGNGLEFLGGRYIYMHIYYYIILYYYYMYIRLDKVVNERAGRCDDP